MSSKEINLNQHFNECPCCGSDDLNGGSFQSDSGSAWQEVTCDNCGAEWQEVYTAAFSEKLSLGDGCEDAIIIEAE